MALRCEEVSPSHTLTTVQSTIAAAIPARYNIERPKGWLSGETQFRRVVICKVLAYGTACTSLRGGFPTAFGVKERRESDKVRMIGQVFRV
jgi:hypothetical protein